MKPVPRQFPSGFSLTEVTIAMGLLAVACALAVLFFGNLRSTAEQAKLQQDVQVLNSAAKVFLANGGSFEGATSPQEVLDRMKTTALASQRPTFVGMTEATIDPRLAVVMASPEEASRSGAIWDASQNRFVIRENVRGGISHFELNEALAEVDYGEHARGASALVYGTDSGWIWDYEERPPTFAGGPTEIPVGNPPDTRPPARPVALLAPRITLSDQAFDSSTPEITIYINNPNPTGSSELFYSLVPSGEDHLPPSVWGAYSGAILTQAATYPDGFVIASYAKSIVPEFLDSSLVDAATTSLFFDTPTTGNVLFIVDASGSMNADFGPKSRFDATIDELISAIRGLPSNIRFNVGMFDRNTHWTDGSFQLHLATQANKQQLISKIESVETGNGTNYSAGLALPLQFTPIPDQVIFLSDGEPNRDDYLNQLQALVQAGVRVDTIGLESNRKAKAVLQRIADETGGSVQFVEK